MSASAEALGPQSKNGAGVYASPAALFLGLAVFAGWIYSDTVFAMADTWWRSDTYAHGMVVLPVFAYMVWARIGRLDGVTLKAEWYGVFVLLLLSLFWFAARRANIISIEQSVVVAMLPALFFTVFGRDFFMRLLFPMLYLFFMVPMGEALVPALQDLTALITVKGLALSGIPVFQEGRYLTIPTGKFEVAEACSGIRYLIASLAVGSCYAYLAYRSLWRRTVFILLALLLPLAANGIRAYGIVMIAHLSEMKYALGADHLVYGWLFFGVVMFVLFWIGSLWREPDEDDDDQVPSVYGYHPGMRPVYVAALAAASISAGTVLAAVENRPAESVSVYSLPLPTSAVAIDGTQSADWMPEFQGAYETSMRSVAREDGSILVYTASYGWEAQGRELINARNRLYDGVSWRRSSEAIRKTRAGNPARVQELVLHQRGHHRLVWYWYVVNGHQSVSVWEAKWYSLFAPLDRSSQSSMVVALATDIVEGGERSGRQRLENFLAQYPMQPEIRRQQARR